MTPKIGVFNVGELKNDASGQTTHLRASSSMVHKIVPLLKFPFHLVLKSIALFE